MNKIWQRKKEDAVYQAQEDLTKEEQLRSKQCYKLLLVLIKYAPIVCCIGEIGYSICAYFNYNGIIFTFLGGFTIPQLLLLYIASYVFRYCYLYRLSLHSILLVNILALYDSFIGIPISNLNILRLYLVILLIGVIAFIYFSYKNRKKKNPTRL